jgi:hypothetical protein
MSKRELGRVEVLARVRGKGLRLVDGAALMRLSYRQTKRLWKRYREEGAAGLKHRSAGWRSNRAYAEKFRCRVLGLGYGATDQPPEGVESIDELLLAHLM